MKYEDDAVFRLKFFYAISIFRKSKYNMNFSLFIGIPNEFRHSVIGNT